jgi:outer membrane receptor protein involved in Fe transport
MVLHVNDQFDVTGSLLIRGSTLDPYSVKQGSTAPTVVDSFASISAGAEYKATKRVSVFVRVNNLFNSTNQTWLFYPDYGFNIFGGVGYAF